jgi:lambda family phage portal protein
MRANLFDRLIAGVSPATGVKRLRDRMQFDALASLPSMEGLSDGEFSGSSTGRDDGGSKNWRPRARDARADSHPLLSTQRGQSRNLSSTSPIAVGAINTNVDRVVGTGLALSAQPHRGILGWSREQATAWKSHVQAEFSLYADSTECDIEGQQNFYEKQDLTLRSTLESGDCFTNMPDGEPTRTQPYRLRLQTLEADRCGNPRGGRDTDDMGGGVRFGPNGVPLGYFIYDRHPGSQILRGDRYAGQWFDRLGRTGRRRILHHFRKRRPGQARGIPYLAPIIGCIKQISRYTEAEIAAAVISAYFTVFIKTDSGNPAPPIWDGGPAAPGSGPGSDAPQGGDIEMGMGAVVGLAKGEEAQFANPLRPNPNFDKFILAVSRQIGMALGIPYEVLLKQFSSSYSASRAALLDAWIYFRSVRIWLARSFCQPVYETWLAEAVAIGRVVAPGFFTDPLMRWAYTRAVWPGDSMGSINPKDEVAAYRDAVDARFLSRERAEWELFGTDWNESFDQKQAEEQRLKDADMLPVPKAGAPAPSEPKDATPPTPPGDGEDDGAITP